MRILRPAAETLIKVELFDGSDGTAALAKGEIKKLEGTLNFIAGRRKDSERWIENDPRS